MSFGRLASPGRVRGVAVRDGAPSRTCTSSARPTARRSSSTTRSAAAGASTAAFPPMPTSWTGARPRRRTTRSSSPSARVGGRRRGAREERHARRVQLQPAAVSEKGARGLMQLMPEAAQRFGVSDRFDAEQSIRGGVRYLAALLDLFKGDVALAARGLQRGRERRRAARGRSAVRGNAGVRPPGPRRPPRRRRWPR